MYQIYYYAWFDNGFSYDDHNRLCLGVYTSLTGAVEALRSFFDGFHFFGRETWAVVTGGTDCRLPVPGTEDWRPVSALELFK